MTRFVALTVVPQQAHSTAANATLNAVPVVWASSSLADAAALRGDAEFPGLGNGLVLLSVVHGPGLPSSFPARAGWPVNQMNQELSQI